MRNQILILFVLVSFFGNASSQCIELESIEINTTPSCSTLKNGVLIIDNLHPKTPYDVIFENAVRSYTTNDSGVLHVYSMAPGTHKIISINDRVNDCEDIMLNQLINVEKYTLQVEGIDKVCEGDQISLTANVPTSWTVNSSFRASNATEFKYLANSSEDLIIHARGIVNSCFERDTFHIDVARKPLVRIVDPNARYCYNKQNEIIHLEIFFGNVSEILFNNASINITDENMLILNTGDAADDNILRITSNNESACLKEDLIPLEFVGEAPTEDIEIIWWPGNIFSVKNENAELEYSWGWLDSAGNVNYVNGNTTSPDGKFYFAGRSNVLVNEIIEKGEESEHNLFVDYRYKEESCFNRLSFNSKENYEFRNQSINSNTEIDILAYPNPFTESITISTADFRTFNSLHVTVAGSDAKIYYQNQITNSKDHTITLSTTHFPRGTYFVYVSSGDFPIASKVIIKQ